MLAKFSTVKLLFFPFFNLHCYLEEDHYVQPTLKVGERGRGELCSTCWMAEYLHTLFGIFHKEDVSLLPHRFVYSMVSLYQYGPVYILCFEYNPIVLYFAAQIIPSLAMGISFEICFCDLLICPFSFAFLSTSLLFGVAKYSRLL